MAKIIGLPKLSPTMEEGVLLRWSKAEGDPIEVDDLMAEVETDKAVMEFRAFDKGVLLKRLVIEGSALAPDAPVAIVGKAGEDIHSLLAQLAGQTKDPIQLRDDAAPCRTDAPVQPPSVRIAASPVVRKKARELGVDLQAISGSGPRGRIILRDLPSAVSKTPLSPPPAAPTSLALQNRTVEASASPPPDVVRKANDVKVPLTPMRRVIAKRMVEAKREAPHFYLHADIHAQRLVSAREELKAAAGLKLSFNDLIVFALSRALVRVPACNVSFHRDHVVHHAGVHLAVAVSIDGGLVTPVLRDADRKSLSEVAQELSLLFERARSKSLRPEHMEGGTCSLSNLGMFGVDHFSAILNPPQAVIVSVGAMRDEPVVEEGKVVAGKRMTLGISCDHRAVDGADAARLLQALKQLLESPLLLLL